MCFGFLFCWVYAYVCVFHHPALSPPLLSGHVTCPAEKPAILSLPMIFGPSSLGARISICSGFSFLFRCQSSFSGYGASLWARLFRLRQAIPIRFLCFCNRSLPMALASQLFGFPRLGVSFFLTAPFLGLVKQQFISSKFILPKNIRTFYLWAPFTSRCSGASIVSGSFVASATGSDLVSVFSSPAYLADSSLADSSFFFSKSSSLAAAFFSRSSSFAV